MVKLEPTELTGVREHIDIIISLRTPVFFRPEGELNQICGIHIYIYLKYPMQTKSTPNPSSGQCKISAIFEVIFQETSNFALHLKISYFSQYGAGCAVLFPKPDFICMLLCLHTAQGCHPQQHHLELTFERGFPVTPIYQAMESS